jgi:hypothetical protein
LIRGKLDPIEGEVEKQTREVKPRENKP